MSLPHSRYYPCFQIAHHLKYKFYWCLENLIPFQHVITNFFSRLARNVLIFVLFLWQIIFKFISFFKDTKLNHKQIQSRHFISHWHAPWDPPPIWWSLTREMWGGRGETSLGSSPWPGVGGVEASSHTYIHSHFPGTMRVQRPQVMASLQKVRIRPTTFSPYLHSWDENFALPSSLGAGPACSPGVGPALQGSKTQPQFTVA